MSFDEFRVAVGAGLDYRVNRRKGTLPEGYLPSTHPFAA